MKILFRLSNFNFMYSDDLKSPSPKWRTHFLLTFLFYFVFTEHTKILGNLKLGMQDLCMGFIRILKKQILSVYTHFSPQQEFM